jgi:predicted peptidase
VPLVVALHYSGEVTPHYGSGLIDGLVEPGLGELGAILVAPDALGGGDWTTSKNEHAVEWLTRSIVLSYAVDPKKVAVTGYSMGGDGTWFIGGRHQDLFTAAIPVEGEPPEKDVEWQIPVYVIHSTDDEIIPFGPVEEHIKRLKDQGVSVELNVVKGLTHYDTAAFAEPLQKAVPWLQAVWSE